jgi:maltose-binding protein MalE
MLKKSLCLLLLCSLLVAAAGSCSVNSINETTGLTQITEDTETAGTRASTQVVESSSETDENTETTDTAASSQITESSSETTMPEETLNKDAKLLVWSILSEEENNVIKEILDGFTQETGIETQIEAVNIFELTTKFTTAATSGKAADIIMTSHSEVGGLVVSKLIRPIEFLDDTYFERFNGLAFSAFMYKGKNYGVGYSIESYGMVYNKALVDKLPQTMEELLDDGVRLTSDTNGDGKFDIYGLLFDPTNYYFTYPIYTGYGGYLFGTDNEGNYIDTDLGIANEGAVSALDRIKELYDGKYIPKGITIEIINNLFCKGKDAITITGPWVFEQYADNGIDFGYEPLPVFENGHVSRPFSSLTGFMLNAYTKYEKEADALLKVLLSDDSIMRMISVNKLKRAPLNKKCYDSDYVQKDEMMKRITDIAYVSEPYPNIPEARIIWNYYTNAVYLVLKGDETSAESLNEVKKLMLEDIAKMKE